MNVVCVYCRVCVCVYMCVVLCCVVLYCVGWLALYCTPFDLSLSLSLSPSLCLALSFSLSCAPLIECVTHLSSPSRLYSYQPPTTLASLEASIASQQHRSPRTARRVVRVAREETSNRGRWSAPQRMGFFCLCFVLRYSHTCTPARAHTHTHIYIFTHFRVVRTQAKRPTSHATPLQLVLA
jgi:hypothetical protein